MATHKRNWLAAVCSWVLNALFSVLGWIIVELAKLGGKLGWWSLRKAAAHPRTSGALSVTGGLVWLVGWQWVAGVVGMVLLTGSVWKAGHRASFEACVEKWLRSWFRKWWAYRRRWDDVMARCGLTLDVQGETHAPKVKKVAAGRYWDRLQLKMQVGQQFADFEAQAERLRTAFRVERINVREIEPHIVGLDMMRSDPFRHESVPAVPIPAALADVDFTRLPLGLTEFLEPLEFSIVGGHLAGGGSTGSGKAGIEWNLLRAMAPAIAHDVVRPIFIDPKARELRQGIALVDVGEYGTKAPETLRGNSSDWPEPTGDYAVTAWDTMCLLERIADELNEANLAAGEAGERDFTPSVETPLRPIFIDELAAVYEYWPRNLRERIMDALGIILTQGRAAGYVVVGVIQETTKDIFKQRDLYTRRIGLRLPSEDQTDAMLTDKAADRGAECSRIPESLPGVCYSFHEGDRRAVRARIGYVRDEDVAELVEFVEDLRARLAAENVIELPVEPMLEIEEIAEEDAGRAIEDAEEVAA
jgi:S-DNA-T family DNA segregation ATPase FtsK/SpoIIIE